MTLDQSGNGCKKDAYGRHYWQYLGWDGKETIAFKCSQCGLCKKEKLNWMRRKP